jgi:hypothetical protein
MSEERLAVPHPLDESSLPSERFHTGTNHATDNRQRTERCHSDQNQKYIAMLSLWSLTNFGKIRKDFGFLLNDSGNCGALIERKGCSSFCVKF